MYKKVIALLAAPAATVDRKPLELLLLGLFSCTGVCSWVSCAGATAAPSCSHSDKLQSPTGILSTEGPLQEYCQLENYVVYQQSTLLPCGITNRPPCCGIQTDHPVTKSVDPWPSGMLSTEGTTSYAAAELLRYQCKRFNCVIRPRGKAGCYCFHWTMIAQRVTAKEYVVTPKAVNT